ncbi:MAG: stage III sporulation protein AD [Clostridia bacterium]|nr:stage III sporulation protein AD [Clostridia bacterium]MBQ4628118.1 stage III sporulation protein AD [Clostridia bacterium]
MNIFTVAAVGLIGTFFAVFMRKMGDEYRVCVSIFCVCALLIAIFPYFSELLAQILSFSKLSGTDIENFTFLLKAVGIGYISQFSSDICADAGENAIASKIEFAGRICILAMTVPVVSSLVEMIGKML